jgi:hypothetical protein
MQEKRCKQCLQIRPLSEFYRCHSKTERLKARCRNCLLKTQSINRRNGTWKQTGSQTHLPNRTRTYKYKYKYQPYDPIKARRSRLKSKYRMTLEAYSQLLHAQGGVCAICDFQPTGTKDGLVVDHDHTTNAVRGLLCAFCNSGLGYFRDNTHSLIRAQAYLLKAKP